MVVVVQDTLTNQQIAGSSQAYRNFSNLGHKKALSSSSRQVQTVSRRWLHSIGLSRPGTADYVISKSVFERFGIARRGMHDVARRVGSSSVQKALQQNAGARRAFSSENPRKKGGYFPTTTLSRDVNKLVFHYEASVQDYCDFVNIGYPQKIPLEMLRIVCRTPVGIEFSCQTFVGRSRKRPACIFNDHLCMLRCVLM